MRNTNKWKLAIMTAIYGSKGFDIQILIQAIDESMYLFLELSPNLAANLFFDLFNVSRFGTR